MATTSTETETLSLQTSTAPSDFTSSTCLPPQFPDLIPGACEAGPSPPADWDTNVTPNMFHQGRRLGTSLAPAMGSQDMGAPGKSVEEACKRSLNHFPCPGFSFPMPALEFDFRIAVKLNPEAAHTDGGCQREITTVSAGVWSGSFGHGRVVAGGYDLGQARGFRPMRLVEGAFVVQTTDEIPAVLEMRTRGSLSGPCEVLDALLSPCGAKNIDPRRYGFRMFATMKTADKRYAEIVNCGLWVASGTWRGDQLIIDAYRVT